MTTATPVTQSCNPRVDRGNIECLGQYIVNGRLQPLMLQLLHTYLDCKKAASRLAVLP